MIHREKSYAEIYHDGNQGYYYNFDTKIFYIKSFETPNYQKENLENIKKYSSIITFLVLILIPINNWYRTIANLKLNLILAIMFIVIALVVVNKLNNIVSKQKRNIDNISYEKMEFDKEKIANIIVSAEELSNKLLFLLVISLFISLLLMLYFKYSVLIFFPIALMLLILSRLLLENIDFFERKNAINEIKKQYNF
ncbi:TPA: hypothetical protein ACJR7Q_000091 [Streptococcus agalactiae]|uniref:hypothetical protein n=1 Tax=Streptococcus agalactiae TaxID=1311 RepID=UPI002221288E|nr:hypothetical protein [Streptococcus agalactiae]MCW1799869.1 hypothetical protein [Streptococcus agalactiae]HEO4974557.1 hypothetical protein [Streptococcus agalactiae]HEO4976046.1 hypothetical protein [Streptococcus agalactiae]HEO6059276.1 hypothetical protein [Streptococcus agalactiae]